MDSNLVGTILVLLPFILFAVVVYFILRPLFLWYCKIYAIMSELQENNRLLREILDELKIKNIQTPSSQQPKEDYSKYMPN